jgi:hypothetical protein
MARNWELHPRKQQQATTTTAATLAAHELRRLHVLGETEISYFFQLSPIPFHSIAPLQSLSYNMFYRILLPLLLVFTTF